jgi:hypothetical protein
VKEEVMEGEVTEGEMTEEQVTEEQVTEEQVTEEQVTEGGQTLRVSLIEIKCAGNQFAFPQSRWTFFERD